MSDRRSRPYAACASLVVALLIAPAWLCKIAPLSDWPNHLARLHVLAHYGHSEHYRASYAPAWGPFPNLAVDLLGVPLARVLPVDLAGRALLSLALATFAWGVIELGRTLEGRWSWRALIACFFALNESLLLGYVNFTFGIGLAFAALGLTLREPLSQRSSSVRVFTAAVALGAAISHAAAAVSLAIGFAGVQAARVAARKRAGAELWSRADSISAITLAPAWLYFAHWLLLVADRSQDKSFASLGTSARLLVQTMVPTYHAVTDLAFLAALAAIAGAAVLLGAGLKSLRIAAAPALAACLFAAAVFAAPADFGGSYEANGRYVVGAWVFGLWSLRFESPPRAGVLRATWALALALFSLRQLEIARQWRSLGADLEAQIRLFDALPAGTKLGNLTFLDERAPRATRLSQRALLHATAYAAVTREANVPTLYAIPGVQPLRHREPLYDAHRFKLSAPPALDPRVHAELDAALLCRAPADFRAQVLVGATSVGRAGDCELIRFE